MNPVKNLLSMVRTVLLLGLVIHLSSCKKNTESVTPDTTENQAINQWIYEQMSGYYFWTDKLPTESSTDQTKAPEDYFNSLLYAYNATSNPNGDRFSYISDDAEALESALNGETVTTGMQYRLFYRDNTNTSIYGQVLYVLKGSPADAAGFKRGDLFTKVNGTTLTASNYLTLLYGTATSFTYTMGTINASNTGIDDTATTRTVTAISFQEDPVFLDSTYTVNGKKIGYLVYNQFVSSPNGTTSNAYDNHLREIFGKFKSSGVQQLVLDLRYNPGGSGETAQHLASLIAKVTGTTQVFYREEYNTALNAYIKQQYGNDSFNVYFTNEPNSIGGQITKVTVLTSEWTASASELVINGLKPYVTVNLIGETTYGKNVGSTTLTDDTKKIKYALQPIIVKVYNSQNQSDYTAGFTPNLTLSESTGSLYQLGDTRETLLAAALQGTTTGGRVSASVRPLSSSLTQKATFGKLILKDKKEAIQEFIRK